MSGAITFDEAISAGLKDKIQHVSRLLVRKEIASIAGVTQKDIMLFENDKHLDLVTTRKIARTYELIYELVKDIHLSSQQ